MAMSGRVKSQILQARSNPSAVKIDQNGVSATGQNADYLMIPES